MKKTTFGTLLSSFRFQRQQAIDKSRRDLYERNKSALTKYGNLDDGYEVRESTVQASDGSSTTRLELWQRVDVERVRISTQVNTEILKDETKKDEDDWT